MSTITDPTNSTRSTPTITASDAILHIGSSTFIAAPSPKVWETLLNTSTWPSWNSFVPRVTIRSHPDSQANPNNPESTETPSPTPSPSPLSPILQLGTKMTFHVRMDPTSTKPQAARDVHLVVTECVAPNPDTRSPGRIVWVADYDAPGAMPRSLLTAERVHEITDVEVGEGGIVARGTEVRNWEAQVGWLVHVVKLMYGTKLRLNFEAWVEDLKRFVESSR